MRPWEHVTPLRILLSALCLAAGLAAGLSAPQISAAADVASPGVDLAGLDLATKPGDDFDQYANGGWRDRTEIPGDRSWTGTFQQITDRAEGRTVELIRRAAEGSPPAGSPERKVADFYAAFLDAAALETRGLAPLQPEFRKIAAISDRRALARALGESLRADVDPLNNTEFHTENLFGLFVTQAFEDPTRAVPYLLQGGLGMPDREYYLSEAADKVELRSKYQTYVAEMLRLADVPDAAARAKRIVELEHKIAEVHAGIVDSQDVHKANNPWRREEFAGKAPGLDWDSYFGAAGLSDQPMFIVWQPAAVAGLSALVASEPLEAWKDFLVLRVLNRYADVLPKTLDDAHFGFYGTALSGTPRQRERWNRAVRATGASLGDAVGRLYVQRYFPPEAKENAEAIVRNILAAFDRRIAAIDWMTPETKAKAKAKLAALRVGIGYPETWRDYSTLQVARDDAFGNLQRAELFEYRHQLAKLGKPVDRSEWWLAPQIVNALNLPVQNAMNFPAAILDMPLFDPAADAAANYGAIGATIGHEISHSFDNMGADFDAEGRLRNWWTAEDRARFDAAGRRLVAQYDAYRPFPNEPDVHVNGAMTLGENIADLAGIAAAYDAYRISLGGTPAPVIQGLTGEQRFFLAFGQSFRAKLRERELRRRLATDVHAPDRYRAQTVRNIDAWYDAFEVGPGEKLHLAPADRVRIW